MEESEETEGSSVDSDTVSDDIELEFEMVERWSALSDEIEDEYGDDTVEAEEAGTHFDACLPLSHEYLGDGMEELRGRTIHSDGDVVSIPLLALPGIIVIPGQVVPLHLFHPQSVSMMTTLIDADRTFGAIYVRRPSPQRTPTSSPLAVYKVGTTVEIQSVKEETVHELTTLKIKTIGRQRFEIISGSRRLDGVLLGKVRILPEPDAMLTPPIHAVDKSDLTSTVSLCNDFTSDRCWRNVGKQAAVARVSQWPTWVYRLYDPYFLSDCLLRELHSWSNKLSVDNVPRDPVAFSHWITSYLPFNDAQKVELLQHSCATLRLRRQLTIIKKFLTFGCVNCQSIISEKKFLFSMSAVGPSAAYVNPGGFIYETITFSQANGLRLRGRPSTEHSWFPGYAWTIAECRRCMSHMGWRFTSSERGLSPSKFWGLSRSHVVPLFEEGAIEPDAKYMQEISLNLGDISHFL